MEVVIAGVSAVLGAALLFAGAVAGWWARDRMRVPAEDSVPVFPRRVQDPIDIPTAGRYVPPEGG